jgi:hypothetical protein
LANWRSIEAVSRTVRDLLRVRFAAEIPIGTPAVHLASTASFEALSTSGNAVVTLFLYRVEENRVTRNAPYGTNALGQRVRPPLPVDLCYLVTVWGARAGTLNITTDELACREEQRLYGLVLQTLSAAAELGASELADDGTGTPMFEPGDSVQLILESPPIEEQQHIWDASDLTYRVSLAFRARIVGIESLETISAPPVVTSQTRFGQTR